MFLLNKKNILILNKMKVKINLKNCLYKRIILTRLIYNIQNNSKLFKTLTQKKNGSHF
jgi:hypothetical protein